VLIRDAVGADREALAGVYRRSSLSNAGDRALLLAHPEVLELDATALGDGRTRAAEVSGEVVGFARIALHPDHVELEALFVDPAWMGHGIGAALVLDAVATARARGRERLEVTGNQHALGFYERVGFVVTGTHDTPLGVPAPRLERSVGPEVGD
jgi:ribosomal protein S18 acetylase RimI-like enzyme